MNSAPAIPAVPLPGERWRSLALARVRKVGVSHPWRELSERMLSRRQLIEPRGGSARRTASESPTGKALPPRLTVENSPPAESPSLVTPTPAHLVANPTLAAPQILDRG